MAVILWKMYCLMMAKSQLNAPFCPEQSRALPSSSSSSAAATVNFLQAPPGLTAPQTAQAAQAPQTSPGSSYYPSSAASPSHQGPHTIIMNGPQGQMQPQTQQQQQGQEQSSRPQSDSSKPVNVYVVVPTSTPSPASSAPNMYSIISNGLLNSPLQQQHYPRDNQYRQSEQIRPNMYPSMSNTEHQPQMQQPIIHQSLMQTPVMQHPQMHQPVTQQSQTLPPETHVSQIPEMPEMPEIPEIPPIPPIPPIQPDISQMQSPITQQPIIQELTTQDSSTQQFITQQPMVQQLITLQPLTQEPIMLQPLTQEPIMQQHITLQPLTQEPIMQQPLTQDLMTQNPIMQQQPIIQQPIMQQPIIQQPIMQQPITQQPIMQQPIMQQPIMQQPITPQSQMQQCPMNISQTHTQQPQMPLQQTQQCPTGVSQMQLLTEQPLIKYDSKEFNLSSFYSVNKTITQITSVLNGQRRFGDNFNMITDNDAMVKEFFEISKNNIRESIVNVTDEYNHAITPMAFFTLSSLLQYIESGCVVDEMAYVNMAANVTNFFSLPYTEFIEINMLNNTNSKCNFERFGKYLGVSITQNPAIPHLNMKYAFQFLTKWSIFAKNCSSSLDIFTDNNGQDITTDYLTLSGNYVTGIFNDTNIRFISIPYKNFANNEIQIVIILPPILHKNIFKFADNFFTVFTYDKVFNAIDSKFVSKQILISLPSVSIKYEFKRNNQTNLTKSPFNVSTQINISANQAENSMCNTKAMENNTTSILKINRPFILLIIWKKTIITCGIITNVAV